MATPKSLPWAILLCTFKNNAAEIPAAFPIETVCQTFFSDANAGFSAARYFRDMSHDSVDLSQSMVFGWYELPITITGYQTDGTPLFGNNPNIQQDVVSSAIAAASADELQLDNYFGVVIIMNILTGWAQGAARWAGSSKPAVVADWRRIDGRLPNGTRGTPGMGGGNGTEAFGHEMSHGFGMQHNRRDGSTADYGDRWDIMGAWTGNAASTKFAAVDADYCARGPGINAWNMRGRGWLDESRVWHSPANDFVESISLRPLHRLDLPGLLAAELPALSPVNGHPKYLVEYRKRDQWDAGLPRSCILVHRYEGAAANSGIDGPSYLMRGINGQLDMVAGDVFQDNSGGHSCLTVEYIDDAADTAKVRLVRSSSALSPPTVKITKDTGWSSCLAGSVEGQIYAVGLHIQNSECAGSYEISWSTSPGSWLTTINNHSPTFSFTAPPAGMTIQVSVVVTFLDGSVVTDTAKFTSITVNEADFREMICRVLRDARKMPIPFWEWDPEKIREVLKEYSLPQRKLIQSRLTQVVQSIQRSAELLEGRDHK